MENDGCRFLFNLYLPRNAWGSETSEIDLIAITHYGVIVFESKNYGGWIFGDERSEKWCQTLRASKYASTKQFFYNPIKQNRNHIAVLKRVLEQGGIANVPTWNIVVFSKHCELKKMSWTSSDVAVVKINDLGTALDRIQAQGRPVVSDDVLGMIYGLLFQYSQANDEIKAKHIENIRNY